MSAKLTFYGGAGEVTGINILLETGSQRLLLDCGLLQREVQSAARNKEAFSYDPAGIDTLLVSHAHADHIGRIPKLVRDGFRGPIYSTAATKELAGLMFDDALRIMEREGDLTYEKKDAVQALSQWQTHEYHTPFALGEISVQFLDAGHILGSAMIRLEREGRVLMFTGDLGNSPDPLLPDTESPEGTHILIMESVYGDRAHGDKQARRGDLKEAIEDARRRQGTLLIPSFSVERTQVLLHELNDMVEGGAMEPLPIFLDSPLSVRVTEVFHRHHELLNAEMRAHFEKGDDPFHFPGLKISRTSSDSEDIHDAPSPKIIVAGSGMSLGGRIREHERFYLPDRDAGVLFIGYQAPGTLGRRLLDGAPHVDIDGMRVPVRATVRSLSGYSGHRDRDGLLSFVEDAGETLEQVFVAMGETSAASFLAQRVHDFLDINAIVPDTRKRYEIAW